MPVQFYGFYAIQTYTKIGTNPKPGRDGASSLSTIFVIFAGRKDLIMKRLFILFASALMVWACPKTPYQEEVSSWLGHSAAFQEEYQLEQLVVLSRHNIRTPMVGKGSVLERLTDPSYQWFQWQDPTSHLTAKGVRLETQMGAFFREWLQQEDFIGRYKANPASFRFYANAKQRCQVTARTFADALFPGANPAVEMNAAYDTMDPVFNPQITKLPAGFEEKARKESADLMGDLDQKMAGPYRVIERVIGLNQAPAYPDTSSFAQFPSSVGYKLNAEPYMTGGLKMACTVSDALVLQYYEEPDLKKAGFGTVLPEEDWLNIALVKEWYGEVLFSVPSVAVNVAHPLLQTLFSELQEENRCFSFLCGHDSNIASVLAALSTEPYDLPDTYEKKTPIGSKLLLEKFRAQDGTEYADLWLVYASSEQIRKESALALQHPPVAVRLKLKGLQANKDQLYLLSDVEQRFSTAIAAYDAL